MIVATLYRSYQEIMNIHELPKSGKYAFEVIKQGKSDNQNWPEEFNTFNEAITFAKKYGWNNLKLW